MVTDIIEPRRDQAFPTLTPAEIDRLRRFGTLCGFAGAIFSSRAGGLAGDVRDPRAARLEVIVHRTRWAWGSAGGRGRAGSFLGELAQLSGRPALVERPAETVEALLIPPRSSAPC